VRPRWGRRPGGRYATVLAVVFVVGGAAGAGSFAGVEARAYPLDGHERTGIRRLRAYAMAQEGALRGPSLPPGARMGLEDVVLRLLDSPGLDVGSDTPRDPRLQAGLERIFPPGAGDHAVALLDVSDPERPRYAALNETRTYLPGSVGKVLVMTGLFDALAEVAPAPPERLRLLRQTEVTADRWIQTDTHDVPIVERGGGTDISLVHRPIREGDRFSLFEWVDHMVSPSANAAAAMVWREAMGLRRFEEEYPPAAEARKAFFDGTPGGELQALSLETLERPLRQAGLDTDRLRQGTLFTAAGRRLVPGVASHASPLQLLRWLVRLEQGRLVDPWSSLEMKRLLYFTRGRYRYASSPALRDAAVYFKSGSFYRCVEEEGFRCGQYRGNDINIMNSVAIVESPARPAPGEAQHVYLVALMSNVLRKNSAEDHRDAATRIEALIRDRPPGAGDAPAGARGRRARR